MNVAQDQNSPASQNKPTGGASFADVAESVSVMALSDVSIGYGTPQILHIVRSLCEHYSIKGLILEPDEPERPVRKTSVDDINIKRLVTATHPYSWSGRWEYCLRAAQLIDKIKPRILVISAWYGLPALLRAKHRPEYTILYWIEHSSGVFHFDTELAGLLSDKIDHIIFPEENRAALDLPRLNFNRKIHTSLLLNCGDPPKEIVPVKRRKKRFFYGGSFHKDRTLAKFFLSDEMKKQPVDIYGIIQGFDDSKAIAAQLDGKDGGAHYRGYITGGDKLYQELSQYLFSIIMWNPTDEATMFASPNKFFDAIACGVPPIAAPHPLCVEIIKRYDCGILMDDWSEESFKNVLKTAAKLTGTKTHAQMVSNCQRAVKEELTWEHQFAKLKPFLPKL